MESYNCRVSKIFPKPALFTLGPWSHKIGESAVIEIAGVAKLWYRNTGDGRWYLTPHMSQYRFGTLSQLSDPEKTAAQLLVLYLK